MSKLNKWNVDLNSMWEKSLDVEEDGECNRYPRFGQWQLDVLYYSFDDRAQDVPFAIVYLCRT